MNFHIRVHFGINIKIFKKGCEMRRSIVITLLVLVVMLQNSVYAKEIPA